MKSIAYPWSLCGKKWLVFPAYLLFSQIITYITKEYEEKYIIRPFQFEEKQWDFALRKWKRTTGSIKSSTKRNVHGVLLCSLYSYGAPDGHFKYDNQFYRICQPACIGQTAQN